MGSIREYFLVCTVLKKCDDLAKGSYRWSRHPSYAGFFYWAVATQLLLGNIVSTLGFVIVLNKFFSARIVGM